MTDRAQFEAMLEALINEDQEAAKEIFHNIVVAKSREIYEELLAEDFDLNEAEEEEEESAEDSSNPFGSEEEEEEEEGEEEEEDGDASDDFADDSETDFDSDSGDEDLEDRVLDLEDALEELKAEFDQLMSGESEEPEHSEMDFGGEEDDMGDEFGSEEDDMGGEFGDEEDAFAMGADDKEVKEVHHYIHDETQASDEEFMEFMEYVNKVALPKHGDNGVNTKSVVDNMKNDMGGTTANILRGDTESPTFANKGHLKGNGVFKGNPKEENFGNINVPGGKAGKTGFTHKEPGHGAEKKGASEKADNKSSLIGKKVR